MNLIVVSIYCGSVIGAWGLLTIFVITLNGVKQSRSNRSLPSRNRLKVSVIIMAENPDQQLLNCLGSLNPNRSKILEIIVFCPEPKLTKNFVQKGLRLKLIKQIIYVAWPVPYSPSDTFNSALKRTIAEVILLLDSSSRLSASALISGCRILSGKDGPEILKLNDIVLPDYRVSGWFEAIERQLNNYRLKSRSYYRVISQLDLATPMLIRRDALEQISTNQLSRFKSNYSDLVISYRDASGLSSMSRAKLNKRYSALAQRFTFIKWAQTSGYRSTAYGYMSNIMALAKSLAIAGSLFLIGYFAYLAIILKEPLFLLITWASFGVIYLHAMFLSEAFKPADKLVNILLFPAFSLWLILSLVADIFLSIIALARVIQNRLVLLFSARRPEVELVGNDV